MHLCVVVDGRLFLELLEHAYKRRQNGLVAAAHEFRKGAPEMRGRLFQMVVRYASEHVVHLVGPDRVDDVVNDSIVAVDGGQLAAHEVPPVVGEPRRFDLVVVKECNNDDVGAEHQQRNAVVDDKRCQAVGDAVVVRRQPGGRHCAQWEHTTDRVADEHLVEWVEVVDVSRIIAGRHSQ